MKLREKPCAQCGWKYPGFHICIDLSKPIDPSILNKHYGFSREKQERLMAGVNTRWERHRDETRSRDEQIVARYKQGGIGIKKLAEEFGIAYQTCTGVLRRAEMRTGEVLIRPRGSNTRWEERSNI